MEQAANCFSEHHRTQLRKSANYFTSQSHWRAPNVRPHNLEFENGTPNHFIVTSHSKSSQNRPPLFPFCFAPGFQLCRNSLPNSYWMITDDFKIYPPLVWGTIKCNWHKSMHWSVNSCSLLGVGQERRLLFSSLACLKVCIYQKAGNVYIMASE